MTSKAHGDCNAKYIAYNRLIDGRSGGDIENAFKIDSVKALARLKKTREANSKGLSVLMDGVRFLARQNLAFRGHDESKKSENKGNVTCLLVVKYDLN